MRILRSTFLSTALLLAFADVAAAAGIDWKTVSLDGNPGFTVDVPAISAETYKPDSSAPKDVLMFIHLANPKSEMTCLIVRSPYENGASAQKLADRFATPARDTMCSVDGKTNLTIIESNLLASNGMWAGECAASYTNPKEEKPGWLVSVTRIAAPQDAYELRCEVNAASENEATLNWVSFWSGMVTHIRGSLHLPPASK